MSEQMAKEAITDWGEDLVMEDSSISLRSLVENYTTGDFMQFRGDDSGYDDDVDFENVPFSDTVDYSVLDLAELTELRNYAESRIKELKQETSSAPSAESEDAQSSAVGDNTGNVLPS